MSRRPSSDSAADAALEGVPDRQARTFRRTAAGYAGVLLAASAATAAVAVDAAAIALVGATLAAFAVGTVGGLVVSRRVSDLPLRLGRTRVRRAATQFPAVPFGLVAGASLLGVGGGAVGLVALASAIVVWLAGYLLSRMARTRAVAAATADEPIATSRWQPPRSPILDRILLVLWPVLAGLDAVAGDRFGALGWAGLGLAWLASGLAEGRFDVGRGVTPEIRLHENGLVKRRPLTATFVPWDEVDHVRLREGELVLDRGLFDVRFDSDALEAPEDVVAAIEQRLSADVRVP